MDGVVGESEAGSEGKKGSQHDDHDIGENERENAEPGHEEELLRVTDAAQHVAEKRRGLIAAIAGIDVGSMLAQTTVKPTLKDYNLNEVSLIGSREDTIRRAISEVIRLIQSLEHR